MIHIQTKTMSLLDQESFQFCFIKPCDFLPMHRFNTIKSNNLAYGHRIESPQSDVEFIFFVSCSKFMKTCHFVCAYVQSPLSVMIILSICVVSDFLYQMLYFQSSYLIKLESSNPVTKFLFC